MFKKLIAALAPSIERESFMEEVIGTKRILNEHTLAPYRLSVEEKLFTGNRPFKTTPVIRINNLVARHTDNRKNFIEQVCIVLSNLSSGFEQFEKMAEITIQGKVLDKVGLSYRKATFLHLLGLIDFFCTYSRMILLYTYGKEIREFKSMSGMDEPFSKGEIKFIEEHAENFGRCLEIFRTPMTKILATIDTVPDIVYNPAQESAVRAQAGNRLDPLGLGFVPVISDVLLFIGLRVAESRALRYRKAEQDKKSLELRIAQYRAAVVGKPDAVTDSLIKATEDELRGIDMDIDTMRKKWRITA